MKRLLVTVWLSLAIAAMVWIVYQDRTVDLARKSVTPAPGAATEPQRGEAAGSPVRVEVREARTAETPPAQKTPPVVAGEIVLTGILLFQDGAPLIGARCTWSIQGTNGSVSGRTLTDGEGRFRIPCPARIRGEPRMVRLRARWDDLEKPWVHAETAIAAEYPPGEHDVGFLPVDVLPLLASGRVVDAAGAPVPDVRVYAMAEQINLAVLNDEGHAERLSTLTDANGRFTVRGSLAGETFRLVARRSGYFQSRTLAARIGEREVTIEVSAAGGLAGSLRFGGGITWQQLSVELSGQAVLGHLGAGDGPLHASIRPLAEGQSLRVPVTADGTFEVGMLRPGSVACTVRCIGLTEPVANVEFVRVSANDVVRDERLQAIDLRNLRALVLTVVDGTGRPVEGLSVGIRDIGKSAWEGQVTGRGGHLAAATAIGAIDVLIQQGGFERQLLTDVRGDRTITVGRGLPALLNFDLGDPVAEFEVAAQLVGEEADRAPSLVAVDVPRSAVQVVEAGAPMEFRVPGPGVYRLEVTVRVRGGPALHAWKTNDLAPLEVEVPVGGTSRVMAAKLSKDAVGKAVRQIRYFYPTAGIVR